MPSPDQDKLVMLLSSDWFLPYWHLIGIRTAEDNKVLVRDGCRTVVRQIIAGASQYWEADFSPERQQRTRSLLEDVLGTISDRAVLRRVREILAPSSSDVDGGTRWLLVSMTDRLIRDAGDVPPLSRDIKEKLSSEWQSFDQIRQSNFKQLCVSSPSQWDRFLSELTKDLPAMLADYLSHLVSESRFAVLWGIINSKFDGEQRQKLFAWYRSLGESLTGRLLNLP